MEVYFTPTVGIRRAGGTMLLRTGHGWHTNHSSLTLVLTGLKRLQPRHALPLILRNVLVFQALSVRILNLYSGIRHVAIVSSAHARSECSSDIMQPDAVYSYDTGDPIRDNVQWFSLSILLSAVLR